MQDQSDEEENSTVGSNESGSELESPKAVKSASSWSKFAEKHGKDDICAPGSTDSPFDAYFSQANRASRTSANVFSHLVPPMTAEDFRSRMASMRISSEMSRSMAHLEESHVGYFPNFLMELVSGFNLLFYGFGSKRTTLNQFAKFCAKKGHVVVANAFFPEFSLKDTLSSIERLVDAPDIGNAGTGPEVQCRRILSSFVQKPSARRLFIVIHNIDSMPLRSAKAKNCLASLAAHPSIHLVGSIDHINAPLLWSTTDNFARPKGDIAPAHSEVVGFSWLWHDLTTMQSYDFELSHADRTSYAGASASNRRRGGQVDIATASGGMVSESAAQHVLASVTSKAKKLFALLCQKQLEVMESSSSSSATHVASSPHVATSYELLFTAARDEFIATNDTSMRALLGEFRDHGLVGSVSNAEGGESLWIPLAKDVLTKVAHEINQA